jgi:hypothetical protein
MGTAGSETRAELRGVASLRVAESLAKLARMNGNGWSRNWMNRISELVGGFFRWAALA